MSGAWRLPALALAFLLVPLPALGHAPAPGPIGPPGSLAPPSPAALPLFLPLSLPLPLALPRAAHAPVPLDVGDILWGSPSQPGQGPMEFVCPQPTDARPGYNYGSAYVHYGCPLRVYDFSPEGNTLSPFGNIQLSVDPSDPDRIAFFTLHGQAADGPTNRSRNGNTHSTYTTSDGGTTWQDNWTQGCPGEGWLGEAASGSTSPGGNVTLTYLWRGASGSLFHAYRMPPTTDFESYMGQYCSGGEWAVESAGAVGGVHAMHVPPAENSTAPGWTVVAWQETDAEGRGALRFAQAQDGDGRGGPDPWLANAGNGTVGGCAEASNAVAWDGRAWVACVVGDGYAARRARPGDVDLWSYDPESGAAELVSFTGLRAPNPRLAVTPDGYFALFGTQRLAAQQVSAPYTTGWHGKHWRDVRDLGTHLHALLGSRDVRSAHVTAVALVEDTKTIYLVYKEWNHVQDNPLAGGVPGVPDPNNPELPRLTDYKKVIVSLDECMAPIAASELTLGYSPELVNQQDAWADTQIFDDLFDGLQAVRMDGGEERVFFAVDDYGVAQFGAIRGASGAAGQVCAIVPPPPLPPVPVLPQALSVATPGTYAVGASIGAAALAMVVYLLAARRKAAHASSVKDE